MNIGDIAKLAGVSRSAVSRYLNNGYLSEEKREAVRRVIEETGYRPLVHAQILRTQRTDTIGVIVPKIDSFSVASVVAGIDSVSDKNSMQILLADAHNSPEREREYLRLFSDGRVDGIILLGTVMSPIHESALREVELPFVLVGQHLDGIASVYHDDYHAFRDITDLVMSKGRKRLGYIGAERLDKAVGEQRLKGYQDAIKEAGMESQTDHVVIADFNIAAGNRGASRLFEEYGPLDAIICATDTIALGALQYLTTVGLRVPDDVLLTGQGGAQICEAMNPTLTTIRYHYEESGATAATLLLEKIQHEKTCAEDICLGYEIVENASTRP